jgi:hypothetical protein
MQRCAQGSDEERDRVGVMRRSIWRKARFYDGVMS